MVREDPILTRVLVVILRGLIGVPFGAILGLLVGRIADRCHCHFYAMCGAIVGAIAAAGLWRILAPIYARIFDDPRRRR